MEIKKGDISVSEREVSRFQDRGSEFLIAGSRKLEKEEKEMGKEEGKFKGSRDTCGSL